MSVMDAELPDETERPKPERLGRGIRLAGPIAVRDLLHEPLITICLIFSVVAVLTPILLLTSVKVGFIDSLRQQFIEDPSFRQIRPGSAQLRPPELFEKIAEWDGISYVIPTVMMNPREVAVRARSDAGVYRGSPRLLPSTEGDPFLNRLTGEPPSGEGVVLTRSIMEEAGLEIGDAFTVGVTRIVNDERATVRFDLTINGWVPTETIDVPAILADPVIEQQVEAYRAGIFVPERGWAGVNAEPDPTYSRVLVIAPDGIGATLESETRVRVGAINVETVDPVQISDLLGVGSLSMPPTQQFLLLDPGGSFYTKRDVLEGNDVLANSSAKAVGLSMPRDALVFGETVRVAAIPKELDAEIASGEVPDVDSRGDGYVLNDRISLPEHMRADWEAAGSPDQIPIRFEFGDTASTDSIDLDLRHVGFHPGDAAIVSNVLLGLIARGEQVALDFDPAERLFVEKSAGFRGFRIVGENIDRIPDLVQRFEAENIEVRAKSSQILKLQRLEQSLNLLVVVVASVALAGGVSILTSSFFANVQRKRVGYATLRLIGMPKSEIALIPILQASLIAGCGLILSIVCFFLIAALLNGVVSQELDFEGQLSKLNPSHFFWAGVIVIGGSCLSSLLASRAATQIDPAAALRAGS